MSQNELNQELEEINEKKILNGDESENPRKKIGETIGTIIIVISIIAIIYRVISDASKPSVDDYYKIDYSTLAVTPQSGDNSNSDELIDSAWGYWGSYKREDGLMFSIYPIDTQTCYLAFGNEDSMGDIIDIETVKTADNTAESTSSNGAKLYLAIDWEFGTVIIQQSGDLDDCNGIDFSGTYSGVDSTYKGRE